ncbi:Per1-like protein [Jimgerdemannia flammicorona]|uniref:Post-GPI attachment to proteins factor 3 n=1 Tax=Jimgerdemannia flammicorona TaxID=994334 RepID=A0A433QWE8_9FUNG|nr:Per1-like protein [Jimgerdemannia flammicorona]
MKPSLLFAAFAFALLIQLTNASEGDRSYEFFHCVTICSLTTCSPDQSLPLTLRLTFWTCPQNCEYTCMHRITDAAKLSDDPILQYYGKWPFHRFLGIQEPASVLFSLGNGYMHLRHWSVLRQKIPLTYHLRPYYLSWVVVGVNSWLWSAVFHTRDFNLTEKLDYYSAALSILYALFFAVVRILRLRSPILIGAWGMLCLACYTAHVSYLSFVRFDYHYNIIANGAVAVLHNLFWLTWSAWQYTSWSHAKGGNRAFAWYPAAGVVLVSLAMALEVFDFPPYWGVFDAHSLWHLSTIPLIPIWHRFMLEDTRFEVEVGKREDKMRKD